MRLPNRPISTERQIKTGGIKSDSKLEFSVGKKISATIVDVQGDKVILKIGDKIINAKNGSSENLFSGTDAIFEVVKSSEELIEIRPSALSQMSNPETDLNFVKTTLSKMGISFTEENIEVLSEMMKSGNLISKGNFDSSKLLFKQTLRLADVIFKHEAEAETIQKPESQNIRADKIFSGLKMSSGELLGNKETLETLKSIAGEFISKAETNADLAKSFDVQPQRETTEKTSTENPENINKDNMPESGVIKTEEKKNTPKIKGEISNGMDKSDKQIEDDKELVKKFLKSFKELTSDRSTVLKSLSFLSKNGIKPNIINITLAQGFLTGKNGVSEAVLKLLENPAKDLSPNLKEALHLFKGGITDFSKLETIEAKDLENLFKVYENLSKELGKTAQTERAEGISQTEYLQQNVFLSKEMSPIWSNFVIPFVEAAKIEDIEVFVKKDGKNKSAFTDNEDRLVYLSLKTHNIDRIKVRIDYKPKSINLIFFTKEGDVTEYVKDKVQILKNHLQEFIKKQINVSVNPDKTDISLLDFEYIASQSSISKIDFRV